MKKIALSAALFLSASTAFAGNMKAPVMEAPIMAEAPERKDSFAVFVPLLILTFLVAAVTS